MVRRSGLGASRLAGSPCTLPIVLPWSVVSRMKRFAPVDHFCDRSGQDRQNLTLPLPIAVGVDLAPIDPTVAESFRQPLVRLTPQLQGIDGATQCVGDHSMAGFVISGQCLVVIHFVHPYARLRAVATPIPILANTVNLGNNTKMKALLLTEYKKMQVTDVDEPEVGPDDVLVQVEACGICGSDIHGYDGSTGRRIPPLVMGHEAAGIVVADRIECQRPAKRNTCHF